ncbi:hypothetical protein BKA62DRAFT_692742 [Auriculariales sp. MPI-PUGE-AT-0066]|nr:hypothetical protein BKA62DRAFT_692742 [Auriculariales sp. MPI-PUGE-AT-0066]
MKTTICRGSIPGNGAELYHGGAFTPRRSFMARSSSPASSSSGESSADGISHIVRRIQRRARLQRDDDTSLDSDDTDYSARLAEIDALQAQQEWEEGIEQLYTIMSLVLLPLLGKYLGRKFTHWSYARYHRVGLGARFFMGEQLSTWFPVAYR